MGVHRIKMLVRDMMGHGSKLFLIVISGVKIFLARSTTIIIFGPYYIIQLVDHNIRLS